VKRFSRLRSVPNKNLFFFANFQLVGGPKLESLWGGGFFIMAKSDANTAMMKIELVVSTQPI